MDITNILRPRRKSLGLSIDDVGAYVGVSRATVARWETGEIKYIGHPRLVKLAEVLRVPVEYLLGECPQTEKEGHMKKEIESLKKKLTSELFGELEDMRTALYPLQAAVSFGDEQSANEAILELALLEGELRLTAYRLTRLLNNLADGAPEA